MAKPRAVLPRATLRVLESGAREGKSAKFVARQLAACGITMPERTVLRRLAQVREEDRRGLDLQQLGFGFGLSAKHLAPMAGLVACMAPEWRTQQVQDLRALFSKFLERPSGLRWLNLVMAAYSFTVGDDVVGRLSQPSKPLQGDKK